MQEQEYVDLDLTSPDAGAGSTLPATDGPTFPTLLSSVLERYPRTGFEDHRDEMAAEASAVARAGMDVSAALACAVICAAACNDCGPALAYGPWATSRTLQMLTRDVHDVARVEFDAGTEVAALPFVDWLGTEYADIPTLLLPRGADATLLHDVQCSLLVLCLRLQRIDEWTTVLLAEPRNTLDVAPADLGQPLFTLPVGGIRPAAVRLISSALWLAVAAAVSAEVDMDDYTAPVSGKVLVADRAVQAALMSSAWPHLVPDVSRSSLPIPARLDSLEELETLWLSGLSTPGHTIAAHALRSQAKLVWQLAVITARNPTAGYRGLLMSSDEHVVLSSARAASEAGVHLVAPLVESVATSWRLELDDGRYELQCPVIAIPGLSGAVAQLLAEQRAAAPFVSLSDLALRVPVLPQQPEALCRVVASGACRSFLAAEDAEHELVSVLRAANAPGAESEPGQVRLALAPALDDWRVALDRRWSPLTESHATGAAKLMARESATRASAVEARSLSIRAKTYVLAAAAEQSEAGVIILSGADRPLTGNQVRDATEQEHGHDDSIVPVETSGWRLGVSRRLIDDTPPYVAEVVVELAGDRAADLARIASVHALLDRHPGPVKARLILVRSTFKRVIERGPAQGVTFAPALEAEVTQLLGANSITLRLDVPPGGS